MNISFLLAHLVNLQSFTIRCEIFFFYKHFLYENMSSSLSILKFICYRFILFRKGDYYRYLAEFKSGDDRKDVADLSLKAYEVFCCF